MVEARAVLVPVDALVPGGAQVLRDARQVRKGYLSEQGDGYGIQATAGI